MGVYAVVDVSTNVVVNMIVWDGLPGWAPEDGQIAVEVIDPATTMGWLYVDGQLVAPPPPPVVPPTQEEITSANTQRQNNLLNMASQAMAPVLVSLQLGDATDDETVLAKAWQSYYREVKSIDVTAANPAWPTPPGA
ncbi:tail fiber assembly protein [Pseudomonas sp. MWU12-2345]|uniref:tail fiber assembly protein n=1 Tax=Pseudomonas sp. MWU12-2345 TaxID=2928689 RepID=UPI00200D916F|nr:tail fiber assembly protein [Pseudomonas sp. MWU12-2345]